MIRLGLRTRVISLLVAAFCALGVLLAWRLVRELDDRLQASEDSLLVQARLISTRQDVLLQRADAILNSLVSNPALDASATCTPQLSALLSREPAYDQMGVVRPNGDLACSGIASPRPVNFSDRSWFRRTLQSTDIVVGDVVLSRVVGRPGITLSKAGRDASGHVKAVYYVGLSLDWLEKAIASAEEPAGERLAVLDARGVIVVRFPDPEHWTDTPLRASVLAKMLASRAPAILEEDNRAAERRLIAHVPFLSSSAGSQYQLMLSIPKAVVEARARHDAVLSFAALLLVLIATAGGVAIALDRWFLLPVLVLYRLAGRLRAGDRGARSGLPHGTDEVGALAQALDESSSAIEERERRLAYVNRALRVLSAGNRTLLHGHDESGVLEQMCRAIVEAGDFRIAWIGYAQANNQARLIASYGQGAGAFVAPCLAWSETEAPKDPVGRAMRRGTVEVWTSSDELPGDEVWRAFALAHGCRATLTLPLKIGASVMGILNIFAAEADVFDQGTIEVLIQSSQDLALGISVARADVERKRVEAQLREHRDHLGESEARYRTLIEWAPVPIAVHRDGALIYVNPAALRLFGANSLQDMLGMSLLDRVHPDFHQVVLARLRSERKLGDSTPPDEQKYLKLDGSVIDVEVQATAIWFDGSPAVCVSIRDITERKRVDEALRIAAIAFESQEGMYVCTADWAIVRVNRAFNEIAGYSSAEAVGQTPRRLLASDRHDKPFFSAISAFLALEGAWRGEVWQKRPDGEEYPAWLTITAVHDGGGHLTHYVMTFVDMSARKAAEDQIQVLAFYDPLTGLPNRRLLIDRLSHALAASSRHERMSALLFVDLDHFKIINDTLGHDVGDLFLQEVAQRLKRCVRQGDTLARIGGDEFVVMLEGLSSDALTATTQAETVGENIRESLNRSCRIAGQEIYSSASIGITLFDGRTHQGVDEPLMHAGLAMHQAKAAGRDTLRFYDHKMQAVVTARARLENSLRDALRGNQFLLHYQAQVDRNGEISGAEALLRWMHPQRGLVSPAEFIPMAEETGLIIPVGRWVLHTACLQLSAWRNRPELAHLEIAVNVSAREFRQETFVAEVLEVLAQTNANPRLLKLELTEGTLVENVADVISRMHALKAVGVRFSLDDFGTGYSSLAYLRQMPLDQIKIDRSFVKDILTEPNDAAISRMVVMLADSLGLSVIAEGVETREQRDLLADLGCLAHQGFYSSRPLPVEEFERLVVQGLGTRTDGVAAFGTR